MTGIPINIGLVICVVVQKAKVHKKGSFRFGALLKKFLCVIKIEEFLMDYKPLWNSVWS